MRKIYKANHTKEMLGNVLPGDFNIVKNHTSNGFRFMNALYGIELDELYDYYDQARHYSSFENFDYGLDFDFQFVKGEWVCWYYKDLGVSGGN